jgi:hypothetical protein
MQAICVEGCSSVEFELNPIMSNSNLLRSKTTPLMTVSKEFPYAAMAPPPARRLSPPASIPVAWLERIRMLLSKYTVDPWLQEGHVSILKYHSQIHGLRGKPCALQQIS